MKKSQQIVDNLLKKVWQDIDVKMAEGIYTEDFIKSFYSHLLNEVGEESADILIQEFQRESEDESDDEKDIDKFGMMTAIEKDNLKKKKEKQDIEEKTYVKNKKTGNVYKVKNPNPAKHTTPSKGEVEKAKAKDGDDSKKDTSDNEKSFVELKKEYVANPEVLDSLDDFNKYLDNQQKQALELEGKKKVNRLKELDSLRESFKNLPPEVKNTANNIFAKGQTYEGRPNSGIGKNRLGYLDVKNLSENKDYLIESYGDGSPEQIEKFVDNSRPIKVSENYVDSSFDLLPDSLQKALSGKGKVGDAGKNKHFLGYVREDGSVTSDKNDPNIKKGEDGKPEVKRGNPPSKDRGKYIWRAILEQGGKDPYTGLPLDLANIDLEHVVAFDNNDNGTPTEQNYLDREHGNNMIVTATNTNQKKSNMSMKDFIERHVDSQSDKSEEDFKSADKAYEEVNKVASKSEQTAALILEGGKIKKGYDYNTLKQTFDLDDDNFENARDEFKRVVENKKDQKKISTLRSELGKDTIMAMGMARGLTDKTGRRTIKLSSDNLYRGFVLSMAENPDKQEEFKKEWDNARKVGNSDEYRLKGKGQQGMIKYLMDKKLISQKVLDDPKMGKVFKNALKEVFDYDSNQYILIG